MRDGGAVHHTAEEGAQARVGKHLLGEGCESVVDIVFWYGSGDAVQVSRCRVQMVLSPDKIRCRVCGWRKLDHEETTIRRRWIP
jgi:hypothetical protein